MRPRPLVYLLAASLVVTAVGQVHASRHPSREGPPIDAERDCRELVPAAFSAPVLAEDDGKRIAFDVVVFLDGIHGVWAEAILRNAQVSYAPHAIKLKPSYRRIDIPPDGTYGGRPAGESTHLFAELRDAVGRKRPRGTDAVLLLTEKAMFSFTDADGDGQADENEREYGSIGEAACAGGVRWPETSFALVDAQFSNVAKDVGITTAHELGHLLGGHHHLANCAEGAQQDPAAPLDPTTPCTVMWAYAMAISSRFGAVNASVIRGHAVTFAAP